MTLCQMCLLGNLRFKEPPFNEPDPDHISTQTQMVDRGGFSLCPICDDLALLVV